MAIVEIQDGLKKALPWQMRMATISTRIIKLNGLKIQNVHMSKRIAASPAVEDIDRQYVSKEC